MALIKDGKLVTDPFVDASGLEALPPTGADAEHVARLIGELEAGQVDAIAFTSKSQVQRLLAVAEERRIEPALRAGLARTRVAAVGPIVAAELAAAGLRVDAMPEHSYSMKPLVTSLCELLGRAS